MGEGRGEGRGEKRARMPVEMGDAATSIVGRLITLSGCLPQATGVIRATFYSRRDLSLPSVSARPPRGTGGIRKRTGPTSKSATMRRITRYFHVRWLNWNARLGAS